MFQYRRATLEDLETIWNRSIARHRSDPRYPAWKEEFLRYNQSGMGATFVAVCGNRPVGEGTLLFSPQCAAIRGRKVLADGCCTANINALRIQKRYEGKGHISALVRMMELYAAGAGYTRLTIGVEARETRNLAIYLHWGYDAFVTAEREEGELVLYYAKNLSDKK